MSAASNLHLILLIFSIIYSTTGNAEDSAIDICSNKIVNSQSSQLIQSPGYPARYTYYPNNCKLTLTVPEYSIITFTVEGEYNVLTDLLGSNRCSYINYLHITTSTATIGKCGSKTDGSVLYRMYTGNVTTEITLELKSGYYYGFPRKLKFSIRYVVASVISVGRNLTRSTNLTHEDKHHIVSDKNFGSSKYGNNINSTLTVTGLHPHTVISIEFPSGLCLADGESCSDYLDIIGVRGGTYFTRRICGALPSNFVVFVNTTGGSLSFRFKTNFQGNARGFMMVYSVNTPGCPVEGVFSNSQLSADTDSDSTFTVICLPGYNIVNSTNQTQTVECINGQWTDLLPCVEIDEIVTVTKSAGRSSEGTSKELVIAVSVSASLVLLIGIGVVFTVLCIRRRRQLQSPKQHDSNIEMSGEGGDDNAASVADRDLYSNIWDGSAVVPVIEAEAPANGSQQQVETPNEYLLADPVDGPESIASPLSKSDKPGGGDVYEEIINVPENPEAEKVAMIDNDIYGS